MSQVAERAAEPSGLIDGDGGGAGGPGRLARALRWAKWVVLAVWLVLLVVSAPLAGKLTGQERNDAASQLPAHSASLRVLQLQQRYQGNRPDVAVVVYHRAGGLTDTDRTRIRAEAVVIARAGLPGEGTVPEPTFARDAAAVQVPITHAPNVSEIGDVAALRQRVGHGGGGLEVRVAGSPAYNLDNNEALDGLGNTLLYAAAAVVIVLLLLTYRSPVLWLLPLLSVGLGLRVAQAASYEFARHGGTVSSLAAGILTVLAFGAGTDYALLLISRYREELTRHPDRHQAMAVALRRSSGAIVASAGTVMAAMLCLLAARFGTTKGLGPVLAIGVAGALLAMLTLLPALLVVLGRWVFWPLVPRVSAGPRRVRGPWARLGGALRRRPRTAWLVTALALLALGGGLAGVRFDVDPANQFRHRPDSVLGQQWLDSAFPEQASEPVVIVTSAAHAEAARRAAAGIPGIGGATVAGRLGDRVEVDATLRHDTYSNAAFDSVATLRDRLATAAPGSLVGGATAIQLDVRDATTRDDRVLVPLILVVILVILCLLLRAVVSPLLLMATVVLSFGASYGASTFLLTHVFGVAGVSPVIPLYAFLFLVALGVDYNIFLMHRAREESGVDGLRAGMVRALSTTGGVITSAGLVLAGTFAVLVTLPLTDFVAVGLTVALGVLIDTFVVRSILVPALHLDLGNRAWWPSRRRSRG
jgi:RND superfamily putative drug exporter